MTLKPPEYKCSRCGKTGQLIPGECPACFAKSDYQKGFEDGKKISQKWSNRLDSLMRCPECGQYAGHAPFCKKDPMNK